jgi:hypothetical protein
MSASGPRYTEEEARAAIANSLSFSEALRKLGMRPAGGNHATLRRYAKEVWNISTTHFDPHAARRDALRRANQPRPIEEILVEHSSYCRTSLKKRLFREGLTDVQYFRDIVDHDGALDPIAAVVNLHHVGELGDPHLDRNRVTMQTGGQTTSVIALKTGREHGLPVVNAIKRAWPYAHITWVVEPMPSGISFCVRFHLAATEIFLWNGLRSGITRIWRMGWVILCLVRSICLRNSIPTLSRQNTRKS